MKELTKQRQLINTGPAQDFNLAKGCYLSIYARYTEQDITNNRTYYIAELYLYVPQYYYIGSYVYNNVKKLSATGLAGFNTYTGSADYVEQSLGTTEGWVTHEDNGEKTVNMSGSIYFPPWGKTLTVSASATLPKIPRVSDISTEASSYNIGDEITIITDKKSELFTDKISFKFGATKDSEQYTRYLSENAEESTLWNTLEDATELYGMIPNANSGIAQIIVETFNDQDVLIGSKTVEVKLNVVNSNPQFYNFDYEDTNPKTIGLTGNKKTVVKGYSNVKGIVSLANKAVAINGASMNKYRFVVGEKQKEFNYSDESDVSTIIDQVGSNIFVMYAIDSRNNSTPKQISPDNYLDYKKPKILNYDVYRTLNGVGEVVNLKVSGEFWNNNFGIEQNALDITFKYKKTESQQWVEGTSTITPSISGSNFSYDGPIAGDLENTGFNLENSYDIQVIVSDKLDFANNQDVVGSGTPNMAMHKNGTAFGSIYDEDIGGVLQVKKRRLAINENNILKVFASHSLDNGERLLTEDGEIYSNEEVITNKVWVKSDGTRKRVYRRRFDGNLPQQTGWAVFGTLDDIETLVEMYGKFTGNDGRKMVIPHGETGYEVTASIKNKNIEITQTGSNWFGRPCFVVVEYTKEVDYYEPTQNDIYNLEVIIRDGDTTIPTSDLTEEEMNTKLDTIIGGV